MSIDLRECRAMMDWLPRAHLQCGPITLDMQSQAVLVNGRAIELTRFEYGVLEFLMLRAGELVTKADLADRLYRANEGPTSNSIEVFIARLRRKIDPEGNMNPIETRRFRGYRLVYGQQGAETAP